jgi:hypothetical protein
MLSSSMLLLNLILLIEVTFSTPTGDYTNYKLNERNGGSFRNYLVRQESATYFGLMDRFSGCQSVEAESLSGNPLCALNILTQDFFDIHL